LRLKPASNLPRTRPKQSRPHTDDRDLHPQTLENRHSFAPKLRSTAGESNIRKIDPSIRDTGVGGVVVTALPVGIVAGDQPSRPAFGRLRLL
ncbi:MAG TPA: hypothetical protein VF163_09140, partial [Micromonosporaceae bacterium]